MLLDAESFPLRLKLLLDGLGEIIDKYQPQEVAIEKVFMARNPDSALKLGQARGAAMCAAVMRDLPVHEYAAKEIKLAVVGKGSADKVQVQHMIGVMLNLNGKIQADAADALAVAMTHAHVRATALRIGVSARDVWRRKMIGRLKGALVHKQPPWLMIDVGGVGYELEAPMSTFYDLPEVGREVTLFIHHAVKEDAVALYGFMREIERRLFRDVQKVTGIGAKIALAILSGASVDEFARLVQTGDVDRPDAHSRHRQEDRRAHRRGTARPRGGFHRRRGERGRHGACRNDPVAEAGSRPAAAGLQAGRDQPHAQGSARPATVPRTSSARRSNPRCATAEPPRKRTDMSQKTNGTGAQKPWPLVIGAIGVVFGDIGTSPLYTLKEAFGEKYGLAARSGQRARHPVAGVLGR